VTTLFLDTTYNQIIGFLDEKGAWIDYKETSGQKSSAQIHVVLQDLVEKNKIQKSHIKNVLYVSGPGFYTGLRIAHGIAEMLRIEERQLFSFYSFDIPRILGVDRYTWITKAYRGEVFIYEFHMGNPKSKLVSEKEFLGFEYCGNVYVHHASALDEMMKSKMAQFTETQSLLIQNISNIFNFCSQNQISSELFYFRPLEEEFKPSV
jgi:tRNA A37 threonylcarbamoyladenosine modification protein TsaB